jgi:hypothetical protein
MAVARSAARLWRYLMPAPHEAGESTENLEPCPFCGSTGRLRLARDDAGYFVLCAFHPLEPSCGAQSGYQNTRDLAIRAWNTRHGR